MLPEEVNLDPSIMYKYNYAILSNNNQNEFVNLKTGNVISIANRNIDEIEGMYSLYVKDEKLKIYLSYSIDSLSSDEEYFKNLNHNPFKIEI